MGVDELLDANSLSGELSSIDCKMLDGGCGERFEEACGEGCLVMSTVALHPEVLDVR